MHEICPSQFCQHHFCPWRRVDRSKAFPGPDAGKDYTPISPAQPTDDPAKVEVLEFFSYGCPHCAISIRWCMPGRPSCRLMSFSRKCRLPLAVPPGRALPSSITRWKSPAIWLVWKPMFSGHPYRENQSVRGKSALTEWVVKKGVDQKKFTDTFNSFGVMSKVKRGDQMAQAYKIQGVPAIGR
jgi:thiol:disulfide interchange protein DsbA